MFKTGNIVKVLIPNVVNCGYDYRLTSDAELGTFVRVTVMNRSYVGIVYGIGDSGLPSDKIKNVVQVFPWKLPIDTLQWIQKMSDWTLMTPGAVLRLIINVPDAFVAPRQEQLYLLQDDAGGKMTENRQRVMDAFSANDNDAMSLADIQNIAHVSASVVRTMINRGMLMPSNTRNISHAFATHYSDVGDIKLNDEQRDAANKIGIDIQRGGFSVNLLDGITGSGKTQVYFDSVWRTYSTGRSVLLMMPEIALTTQFIERFAKRFGAPPVVWHSNLTAARRRDIWRGVMMGEIKIVVGTRSALFLPWQDLGLIVVDEEHDGSYKQEDMGNYHGRDMAVLRAKIGNFPIVLASATPSEETIHNVELGRYGHLILQSRYGGAQLPTIETVDLREHRPMEYNVKTENGDETRPGTLSPILCDQIANTLANHNQVMLFINRRGFAPIVQCKKCGWVATCPECSVGMTYHKRIGKLLCHICGRTMTLPSKCPDCDGNVSMRGAGLEKIAEEVGVKFPTARIELVSSDTMMSHQSLERLVSRMESGELDIIIGTQILAKGHHFPNLTLVGVVDADMGLFGTDFRAAEHTFQQLFQVAGRAGRGDSPGRVLLQTYQPTHPVLNAICAGNRDDFLRADMDARCSAKMPPFGQLIAIVVEGQKESVLKKFCDDLVKNAPYANGAKIMGPVPAQIYQIRNWYRMRFLIMGDMRAQLQPLVKTWLGRMRIPANIRVKIDVNPQNFM